MATVNESQYYYSILPYFLIFFTNNNYSLVVYISEILVMPNYFVLTIIYCYL
ncbi:hypothetical protein C0J52_08117 [Blattella germanica]|nr:hypothetical protein C0J52_08117 [Blattella germanica]